MNEIKINKIYKHFKGNLYKVIGIAKHSETLEDMVIYESLRNNTIWVRPAYMWNETIDDIGTKRFTLTENS